MSLASMAWETAQVRVTRTFVEVVEMCPAPEPRSLTMPALPSLGLDLEEEPATGYAVLTEPNFEEKHHEPDLDQKFAVRVARTFLEVIPDVTDDEIASQQLRSYSMPILPSCGLDGEKERNEDSFGAFVGQKASDPILRCTPILPETENEMTSQMTPPPHWLAKGLHVRAEKEEFAPGYAFVAEASFEEKHHESDEEQKLVMPDVTDDEIASQHLRSSTMPILPSLGLDLEEETEEEESFGAFVGQAASEPILPGTPIFHPPTKPVLGAVVFEEMESQALGPVPHWAKPLLPGRVAHPAREDPNVDPQTWEKKIDVERATGGEVKAVDKEDERAELKLVTQHADTYPGPFPLRMVEQHNNGRCFPCLFFTRTGDDGCRKGDDCTHCHVCRPHEIRRRRNRIAAEMKAARKAAARRQQHRA